MLANQKVRGSILSPFLLFGASFYLEITRENTKGTQEMELTESRV